MSAETPLAVRVIEAALLIARAHDHPSNHYEDGTEGGVVWCNCGRPWPCEIGAAWDLVGPPPSLSTKEPTPDA